MTTLGHEGSQYLSRRVVNGGDLRESKSSAGVQVVRVKMYRAVILHIRLSLMAQ